MGLVLPLLQEIPHYVALVIYLYPQTKVGDILDSGRRAAAAAAAAVEIPTKLGTHVKGAHPILSDLYLESRN